MSNPLRSPEDYELFVYTLSEQFPVVRCSTVAFIRRGATLARVAGELYFDYDIHLVVRERLLCHRLPIVIEWYGHIPPNIKHHRIPTAEMSFSRPNLPVLIREIEAIIEKEVNEAQSPQWA